MEKRSTRVVVGILALAGLLGVLTLATAGDLEPNGAPGPTMKTLGEVEPRVPISAADLPLVITEPGSYYLVEDVNFTSTSNHAIAIVCDDVTIDLMGYTLKGPDSGNKSGIYINSCTNVEIRNGTIRDFGYPAIHGAGSNGSSHRVINIRALSNEYGIFLDGGGHLVKDCTASSNDYHGIYANYSSMITGNMCCDNVSYGIYISSHSSTVTGNTCYNNGTRGIFVGAGSTIIGNTARDNTNYGIYALGYCLIDQNTAYGNTGGNLSYGTGCVLGTNCAP